MKLALPVLLTALLLAMACQKERFTNSADATLLASSDTLYFDTVFTARGSVTKSIRISNPNEESIRIGNIKLGGGNAGYQINVNGMAGSNFEDVVVKGGDSIYVFVRVTVDPNSSTSPFLVSDSLLLSYNGNTKAVQLQAFGQNARYITSGSISTNTTWNNQLPYVITRPLTIASGTTLTITEGTRIYCRATAPIVVNGSLRALGKQYDSTRITFRSDRLDDPYRELPGSWPGIVFTNSSNNNLLRYTHLEHAYQAIAAGGGPTQVPAKLVLENCVIDNAYDIGIYAFNTSIQASNCRITQVGNEGTTGNGGSNLIVAGGGNYQFEHCTVATYGNYYQNHKQPSVVISNQSPGTPGALQFTMTNSIIWGQSGFAEDELVTNRSGTASYSIAMRHVLYKAKNDPQNISFVQSLRNTDPLFDTINTNLRRYNFRLRASSPAVNAGMTTTLLTDLDGKPRTAGTRPDLGAYENQ